MFSLVHLISGFKMMTSSFTGSGHRLTSTLGDSLVEATEQVVSFRTLFLLR